MHGAVRARRAFKRERAAAWAVALAAVMVPAGQARADLFEVLVTGTDGTPPPALFVGGASLPDPINDLVSQQGAFACPHTLGHMPDTLELFRSFYHLKYPDSQQVPAQIFQDFQQLMERALMGERQDQEQDQGQKEEDHENPEQNSSLSYQIAESSETGRAGGPLP